MPNDNFNREALRLLTERSLLARHAQVQAEGYLQNVVNRLADYFGYRPLFVPRAVMKGRPRLIEKVQEARRERTGITPQQAVETIKDLAAGRMLVNGLADIEIALNFLNDYAARTGNISINDPPRNFVDTPRPTGFRGLQVDLTIKLGPDPHFPFELQIMTFLQHAWDQLHHRTYEMIRAGGANAIPDELNRRFQELSDALYRADREIDDLRFGPI